MRLLDEEINTDMEIKVVHHGNRGIFKAHKAVVFSRFPSLAENLQPTDGQDLNSVIDGICHSLIWRFLKWCYMGNYPRFSDTVTLPSERELSFVHWL